MANGSQRLLNALPRGRWARLLLVVGVLLTAAQAVGALGLQDHLLDPDRVAAYERRGYEVEAKPPSEPGGAPALLVTRERSGGAITRDVGEPLQLDRAVRAVAAPALAALLAFALLNLLAWLAAGRPADRHAVTWDRSLPALWLVPTGMSVLLLTRLGVDVPAASTSRFPSALSWAARQSEAAVLGAAVIVAVAAAALFAEQRDWWQSSLRKHVLGPVKRYDALLLLACGLFAAVKVLGQASFGATVTLSVGGASLQVVEAAKLLLVLHAAYMLADLEATGQVAPRALDGRVATPALARLFAVVGLAGGSALVFSGDLGTAVLAAAIPLIAGFVGTGSVPLLAGSAAAGAAGLGLIALLHRPAHAYERIVAMFAPFERSESLAGIRWALAEGGLLGTGLGSGKPQVIPNVDSDFILAAVGEELGWVGLTLVLLSTIALVHRGLVAAVREEEALRKNLAAAAALALGAQALVITAGTLGMIPATGVPYPLLSRGGASLLVNSALVGLIVQVSFVHAREPQGLHPYPQWMVMLRRLRGTAAGGFLLLGLCWGWAGWLMLGRAADDVDRPYIDRNKVVLAQALIDGGVLRANGRRVTVHADALPAVADTLKPELRRRVSVARSLVDGRPLQSVANALAVGTEGPRVVASRFSIRNPRRRDAIPFRIVDRAGRLLAGDRGGQRVHPGGAAAFGVTGHRAHGTASFLEADAAQALRRLTRRESVLLGDRVRERLVSLVQGDLSFSRPRGPWTVHSTIDLTVQRNAADAMGKRRGAVVAMDLWTGDLIVLASLPAIDPDGLSRAELDAAFTDADRRLRSHRALHERYPPGSTMKVVTASAMLAHDLNLGTKDSLCRGRDEALDISDAGGARHGAMDPLAALAKSCNVFFGRAGPRLGRRLPAAAQDFGFGLAPSLVPWADRPELTARPSHFLTCRSVSGSGPLPPECDSADGADGLELVSDRYVDANPALVSRAAFGQTVVEATPLQMLLVTAGVAAGGRQPAPRIVDQVSGFCGEEECPLARSTPDSTRVLGRRAAAGVRAGMARGYAEGTAAPRHLRLRLGRKGPRFTLERNPTTPVAVGTKTGTAEVEGREDHAWFVAFAPAEDPRIAVVVLVEHGGVGVLGAGPVAMRVLRDSLNAVAE